MNEIIKAMETRHSCRAYKSDMPPKELIEKVCEAGTFAATGMNRQSPLMIAVTNKELRDRLSKMNAAIMGKDDGFDQFYGAPAVIIVLADKNVATHVYDGSLVMGNLMLAAHTLGLASCWIERPRARFAPQGRIRGICRIKVTIPRDTCRVRGIYFVLCLALYLTPKSRDKQQCRNDHIRYFCFFGRGKQYVSLFREEL